MELIFDLEIVQINNCLRASIAIRIDRTRLKVVLTEQDRENEVLENHKKISP